MAIRVRNVQRTVTDFQRCCNEFSVQQLLVSLDRRGWELVCVTPMGDGSFMVYFRRPFGG